MVVVVVVVGDTADGLRNKSLRGGTASQMLKGRCIVTQLFGTVFLMICNTLSQCKCVCFVTIACV